MLSGYYKELYDKLSSDIETSRMLHDPLSTLAWGTDASFYRLLPKLVVLAENESEAALVLKECSSLRLPVTFRAAGTSLSGQAVSDSVLLVAGSNWKNYKISGNGHLASFQPGITGAKANRLLLPYGRKIGPDPASINSAMIGGIAANNASGMCCGTEFNSFKTLEGLKLILADGTSLDTLDEQSRLGFSQTHGDLLSQLSLLAAEVKENIPLKEKIENKYRIKNTTGYSLNSLTSFTDPFDILSHLIIGSEGTLGFIAEITYRTIPEDTFRASSLMIFPDIAMACQAVIAIKKAPVAAAEIMDRAALRSVENEKGIPVYLKDLDETCCALLVETSAGSNDKLAHNIDDICSRLRHLESVRKIEFTSLREEYEPYWKIRKGLFPSVGAMRRAGTTVIIEDVAFPIECLADATLAIREILDANGYSEAVIFGHALEGNLHFVFTQDFRPEEEIRRYEKLMAEVADLVVDRFDGSLKAEHGTGRNMAPFVEKEWGKEARDLMVRIKKIFDPFNILNRGVIINDDPLVHLKDLKPIPEANKTIDKCTECGFCEVSCVSAGFTLSPRQRITAYREISSLRKTGQEPANLASLEKYFQYSGNETCATDGLCSLACPVGIDTGKLVKELRSKKTRSALRLASYIASNMATLTAMARSGLKLVNLVHKVFGTSAMESITTGIRKVSGGRIPQWNRFMPSGASKIRTVEIADNQKNKFVYFPSCINRSMGLAGGQEADLLLTDKIISLAAKAGYEPVFPENMNKLCCGMPFLSKGFTEAGLKKSAELEQALMKASKNGKYPVLCDMSPCLFTMKENMSESLKLYEPVEFILDFLIPELDVKPINEKISLFAVCSMKKMGLEGKLLTLGKMCSAETVMVESNCCGFAGDRGFSFPELNKHGLKDVAEQNDHEIKEGYSTSRTCEIGLSLNTGITYKSIVYLVDKATMPQKGKK